mgnify:CR=1 FL=1
MLNCSFAGRSHLITLSSFSKINEVKRNREINNLKCNSDRYHYESEAIINEFIDKGFTLGKFNEKCDVYLINTCSVTEVSDAKSRKIIRQAVKQNENAVVVVMGCYAQLKPEDIKKIEGVDVLIGTSNRDKVYDGKVVKLFVDEVLTPDSSRFWPADEYKVGTSPVSLDKQYVRDYLETLDWNKTAPGPVLPQEVVDKTAKIYKEAYRMLSGKSL